MSGPSFGFRWSPVNPDLDWQLTQTKSLGDGIQTIGNALNAFGDATRKQNTDALLAQIANAQNPQALAATGILAGIDPLNRTVDTRGLIDAYNKQQDTLGLQQATTMANDFKLNNMTNLDFIKERTELEGIQPKYMGPIADLVVQQRANAAAAAQQAYENKQKDTEIAIEASKANSQAKLNDIKIGEALYSNQGKEETTYELGEDGQMHPVTRKTPSLSAIVGGNSAIPPQVRQAIHAGESGGDYDTLYGNSHKGKGKFANVKLTEMTVDEALEFSKKGGAYAEWSKTQKGVKPGTYATPMGAWQIVGSTLKKASKELGLKGDEKMTPELQDKIADYIYQTQGTDAWEGYKGPKMGGGGYKASSNSDRPTNHSGEVDNPFGTGTNVVVPESAKGKSGKLVPGVGFDPKSVYEAQSEMKALLEAENAKNAISKAQPSRADETAYQDFIKKGGYEGSEIFNRNAELYGTVKNFDVIKKMPPKERMETLKWLTEENQKGIWLSGRMSAKEVKAKIMQRVSDKKHDEMALEKQKRITTLNTAAAKLYQANIKKFPNITMDQAREMVDKKLAQEYKKLRKGA